jgi:hypothetical protein
LHLQTINLQIVALQLWQNSVAPSENQRVAGRKCPFTVEDGFSGHHMIRICYLRRSSTPFHYDMVPPSLSLAPFLHRPHLFKGATILEVHDADPTLGA